jgi:multidrug/hemolysin transport system ATP-binding protein
MIRIENLIKSYGKVKAVDNISFHVEKGTLFAFLGINGAGKSTTISIICSALKKDGGKVFIGGEDIDVSSDKIKREIGVVFQNSVLDKSLSVKANLKSRAALYGITGKAFDIRLNELSSLLDFKDIINRPVGKLSGGQRRRIDIARALLHSPSLLILDEPTTGLDPQTRTLLWKVIETLRKEKSMTVMLTTHYMEEAADADKVVIIDSGKIVASGSPIELKNRFTGDFITLYNIIEDDVKILGKPYEKIGEGFRILVSDTSEATSLITSHPEVFKDYEIIKGKMDDVFLSVTGKSLKGGDEK